MNVPERDEREWNGRVAAQYGCTVTFEADDGATLTLARVGAPTAVLRALCAEAVALNPSYRVTAYSTPVTIASDVRGRFGDAHYVKAHEHQQTPEAQNLSRIGLLWMLHPRLRGTSEHADRKHARGEREREA